MIRRTLDEIPEPDIKSKYFIKHISPLDNRYINMKIMHIEIMYIDLYYVHSNDFASHEQWIVYNFK